MWAVVKTGSKQYKVEEGDVIDTQRLKAPVGDKAVLDKVLLFSNKGKLKIGTPYLEKASVEVEVLKELKAKKIIVFKYKRRKGYKRKRGHRQILSRLKVLKIKSK